MTGDQAPIPFALPDLTEAEIEAVVDVLRSRWLTTGARAREFEQQFAQRLGVAHAVALNSCTAALHLALEAVGVGPGDLVYIPTYTFAATGEVVRYLGGVPRLVDVDATTLNIDIAELRMAIESDARSGRGKPRALIPVHFAGVSCDMAALWELAREFDLAVVEDAAHAFPATRDGRAVGWMPGDVTGAVCFSFYATKTITTGEGGMVVTQSEELAERMRCMSLHGLSRQAWNRYAAGGTWKYDIVAPGYKYNLTDIAAALGLVQLGRADEMRSRRSEIAEVYHDAFDQLPLELPYVPDGVESAWHLYVVRTSAEREASRDRLVADLTARGIGTSVHFIPLHLHSYYRDSFDLRPTDFPVATAQFERALSLPIWSAMRQQDVSRVVDAVRSCVEEA